MMKKVLHETFLRRGAFLLVMAAMLGGGSQMMGQTGDTSTPNVNQESLVKGTVVDDTGEPIIGATVMVKGAKGKGSVTDADGNFMISGVDKGTLVVSYVGYKLKEIPFTAGRSIKVSMEPDTESLDEVVVVGFGTQKKVNLTGSVATLDAKSFESKPLTSASQSLAGQVAGVHIAQSSGIAGSDGGQITIRGLGTLNNTSPLILIDGVISSNMDIVNPADIENISILKDAASASIYGSQAANGVILITTKKGNDSGKAAFNFSAGYSIAKITNQSKPKMVTDTETFMLLMNEARMNSGLTPAFSDKVIELYRTPEYRDACSTDWFDEIFKTSNTQEYNMSVRGGGKKNRYFMSLGYMDQGSIVKRGNYQRITGRINLDTNVTDKFKVGANFGYTYGKQKTPNGSVNEVFALDIMRATPLNPAWNADGTIALPDSYTLSYTGDVQSGNPLVNMFFNEIAQTKNTLTGNVNISYTIFPKLTVSAILNANVRLYDYSDWKGAPSVKNWRYAELMEMAKDPTSGISEDDISQSFYGLGSLSKSTTKEYRINPYLQIDYSFTAGLHHLKAMAAMSYESNHNEYFQTSRGKYTSNYVKILDSGDPTTVTNTSSISSYAVVSQFGRLNYDYDNKYLFEANVRRDGSSRFGLNHRYGVFPSFSAGWVLTSEKFMHKIPFINFLKLRASWGELGNQSIGDNFPYIAKITYNNAYYVWGKNVTSGAKPSTYGNPDIHWETTDVTNLGLDMHFFNSMLTIESDVFLRKTRDILYDTSLPYETGFSSVTTNLAKVQNKGFETTVNFKKTFAGVNISVGGNVSYIKNKVLSINPGLTGETDRHISGDKITMRGYPINSYYMLKWTGKIYQTQEEVDNSPHVAGAGPGDLVFEDVSGKDGVPDGVIDSYDRKIMGTDYPTWTYGANLSISYKGVGFSMDFQGIADAYSYGICEYYTPTFQGSNFAQFWTQRWTPAHPSKTVPRLWVENGPNNNYYNSYFLMDRSYLRLKYVVLSYDFPSVAAKFLGLTHLRAYISASNVYTWTKKNYRGFDPERYNGAGERGGIPQAMTMKLGLDLSF